MMITPVKLWRRQDTTANLIGKVGEIILWSIVRVPAQSFAHQTPFPIVIVKLETGEYNIGQLVDWEEKDLIQGKKVEAVLRRTYTPDAESIIVYNIKFKPL
jgi:uncharacterized OB-fold protein